MGAEVFKKITELDTLIADLNGSESMPIVKSGKTYKRTWENMFGSGWFAKLFVAWADFVAPNATHATDSDTVGGESKSQLHNAANLTGAINLDRIPAELTGKNAATATLAATATNALSCSGNAATVTRGVYKYQQGEVALGQFYYLSCDLNSLGSSPELLFLISDTTVPGNHIYIRIGDAS